MRRPPTAGSAQIVPGPFIATRRAWGRIAAVLVLSVPAAAAWPQVWSDEIEVESDNGSQFERGAIGALPGAGFVLAWNERILPETVFGRHKMQVFDSDGNALTDKILLSPEEGSERGTVSLAVGPGGTIGVAWSFTGPAGVDTDGSDVFLDRFDNAGTQLGPTVLVNASTAAEETVPDIDFFPTGSFVVVWQQCPSEESCAVLARLFDSAASPLTGDITIAHADLSRFARVRVIDADRFLVAWHHMGPNGAGLDDDAINARVVTISPVSLGPAFQVNTLTVDPQLDPAVSPADAQGTTLVSWSSFGPIPATNDFTVNGQLVGSDGTLIGDETVLASLPDDQFIVRTTRTAEGFVGIWSSRTSTGSDTDSTSVQFRMFSPALVPVGPELQVNDFTPESQSQALVAVLDDSNVVFSWRTVNSAGAPGRISARILVREGIVFADGFESAGTHYWSATETDP